MVCTGNLGREGAPVPAGTGALPPGETLDPFLCERLTQQHGAAKAFLRSGSLWCRFPRRIATTCTRDGNARQSDRKKRLFGQRPASVGRGTGGALVLAPSMSGAICRNRRCCWTNCFECSIEKFLHCFLGPNQCWSAAPSLEPAADSVWFSAIAIGLFAASAAPAASIIGNTLVINSSFSRWTETLSPTCTRS